MKPKGMFLMALAISASVHLAFAGLHNTPAPTLDGATISGEVALGSSFADLVSGVTEGTTNSDIIESENYEQAQHHQPKLIEQPVQKPLMKAVNKPHKTLVSPINEMQAAAVTDRIVPTSKSSVLSETIPDAVTASPHDDETMQPSTQIVSVKPRQITKQETHEWSKPTEPSKMHKQEGTKLAGTTVESIPIELTPDSSKNKRLEVVQPAKTQLPIVTGVKPKPKGNANTTASKGEKGDMNAKQASSTAKLSKNSAKKAGDGALEAYKSKILRQISRAPQEQTGGKGRVQVTITIAANGRLSNVAVKKSSGNKRVDRGAIKVVKKAGRFPPTPTGAATRLILDVVVRG